MQPELEVVIKSFPESNGKQNWAAMLVRKDRSWKGLYSTSGGITISRGEYWNRVAYDAERTKFLIGAVSTEPALRTTCTTQRNPYILRRENALRLFQSLHQNDDPDFRRASGAMYCSICGLQYREHPDDDENQYVYDFKDKRLCNGDVVHL